MPDAELWLVTTIVELAEILDERQNEAEYADILVSRLSERLPPAQFCVLIAGLDGEMIVSGASNELARGLAVLQTRLQEGPAIDSYRTGHAVINEVISPLADERWPSFAHAAATAGIGIVSAVPMLRRQRAMGVLLSMSATADPLTEMEVQEVHTLARAAVVGIAQQRALRRSVLAAEHLQRALDSRVLIEQAKGAVAARLGISPDLAFELLRGYARHDNLTLAEVSTRAIRNDLSPLDLVAARQTNRGSQVPAQPVPQSR